MAQPSQIFRYTAPMRVRLLGICKSFVYLFLSLGTLPARSPAGESRSAAGQPEHLIVMIKGEFRGDARTGSLPTPTIGGGVIFGYLADGVYIVTANHVVRDAHSGKDATHILVKFYAKKTDWLPATLLPNPAGNHIDIAVLTVTGLKSAGIDKCVLPMDLLGNADGAKRGDQAVSIGYPNGLPWGKPVSPDFISERDGITITFQSNFIAPGDSGGALVQEDQRLVGLIKSDNPPFGEALSLKDVLAELDVRRYPVRLHVQSRESGPLHLAARAGDIDSVAKLLSIPCPGVSALDKEGLTPLHYAVSAKQVDTATMLLEAGADPNAKDDAQQRTPLTLAIDQDSAELTDKLLQFHADPNLQVLQPDAWDVGLNLDPKNAHLKTPLFESATRESGDKIIPLLIAAGALLNEKGGVYRWSGPDVDVAFSGVIMKSSMLSLHGNPVRPLTVAVHAVKPRNVQLLLDAGAQVDWSEIDIFEDSSPLTASTAKLLLQHSRPPEDARQRLLALAAGRVNSDARWREVVELIIDSGPTKQDSNYRYAAFEAARSADVQTLRIVLKPLADDKLAVGALDLASAALRTDLFWSATLDDQKATLDFLAAAGDANLLTKDEWDHIQPAICSAIEKKARLDTVQYFLTRRDIKAKCHGSVPLILDAAKHETPDVISFLIDSGANPNEQGDDWKPINNVVEHRTPLHSAATNPQNVRVLLAAHARVNVRDSEGDTPLHVAARAGNKESVELMLQAGAKPYSRNGDGKTPIDVADDADTKLLLESWTKR